ncbi:proteasome assembly chaperone 4 isoform X1 [Numida meleagris]|uniref:proteasome assembly chaperone 4 isoform X1 n=1 Tax=Numida meleagris TaxID=8996 RepID=UPI000B3DCB35|nr:proteasome assembly chaperone 4 isoform X1 [Numida meleagris]
MEAADGGPAWSGIGLHDFSGQLGEQRVYFHAMRLRDSLFLWVGAAPALSSLAVAMCSPRDSVPVSTSLLGDPSDTASACLAQRLVAVVLALNTGFPSIFWTLGGFHKGFSVQPRQRCKGKKPSLTSGAVGKSARLLEMRCVHTLNVLVRKIRAVNTTTTARHPVATALDLLLARLFFQRQTLLLFCSTKRAAKNELCEKNPKSQNTPQSQWCNDCL